MIESSFCPVPINQRPLEEYKRIKDSWFFSWPTKNDFDLYKALIRSYLYSTPIIMFIAYGSWQLKNNPIRFFSASLIISLLLPLLLIIRQLLGWNYIKKRLISEKIIYEESGWYDGQVWEKPLDWREKDLLIAQFEVSPIIKLLTKALLITTALLLVGLIIWETLQTLKI